MCCLQGHLDAIASLTDGELESAAIYFAEVRDSLLVKGRPGLAAVMEVLIAILAMDARRRAQGPGRN